MEQDILDWIRTNGYNFVCKTMNKEIVDLFWAKYPDVLSSDGTINPVLEQQTVSKDDSNSLKELELKKQILEMELKLQEMKTQQNK
ncbi:MAG: hypothetical protein OHM56_03090 [Spiroplasma phoeniceum]|nr:MAG: hypothetical protein OHM57_02540 [Spiroplasma phoeniceum]UZQ32951.1 MAG: hypothetical protein OHM56_03090 [Spiroplasma phoeniceum]